MATFLRARTVGARSLLIEGEAGAGKTALWEQGLKSASDESTLLVCRPAEAETGYSFAGLGDLLGGVLDDVLHELPDPQRDALEATVLLREAEHRAPDYRAVGAGTLSALKALASIRPLIVAIDDIQWLDRPSARALGYALRRLSSEQVALLATKRMAVTIALPELEDALRDRDVERIELGPLSVGALERIVSERLGVSLARTTMLRVHEVSRGNPLFALELARALADSGLPPAPGQPLAVPENLQALLLARVAQLPPAARRALLFAALLSQPTEDTLALAFGAGWDHAVARLRAAGVATVVAGVVRISHPLMASAVASAATAGARRDAHRRLADAVTDAEQRARHLALGATGPDAEVSAALERASVQATRRGAPEAAAELAELARVLTPPGRDQDACRRSIMAGEALFAAGDLTQARSRFEAALAVAAPGTDRATALLHLGRTRYYHDDSATGVRILEQAVGEAGDDVGLQGAIEHELAFPALATGDVRATLRHARAAEGLLGRAGATHARSALVLAQVACAEFLVGSALDRDAVARALELENWDEPSPPVFRPSLVIAHTLSWADELDEARRLLVRSEHELSIRGDEGALPWVWYRLAELDCWAGEWGRGLQRALDADRLAAQTAQGPFQSVTCYAVALIAAHAGDLDQARTFANRGVAAGTASGAHLGAGMNMSVLGFVEASLGHDEQAVAILDALVDLARAGGLGEPALLWFLPELIECLLTEGHIARAETLLEWMEGRARTFDRPRGLAAGARCRALVAAGRGQIDEALALCEQALAHHERIVIPFERARALMIRGQIARRGRKWGVARSSLQEAVAEFARLGAAIWGERAEDELGRVGGRRAASPADLTDSESQVAELAARGRSNRQIADALFMSPKTVSATLGRVYRKLGITSRGELIARHAAERQR